MMNSSAAALAALPVTVRRTHASLVVGPATDVPLRTPRPPPVKACGGSRTLHAGVPRKPNGIARQGTTIELRDRLVLQHLPMVKAIAVRVHQNLPVHVDMDDLTHAGIVRTPRRGRQVRLREAKLFRHLRQASR